MSAPLRALGRRLRGLVLPLVGFWELRTRLDAIAARLDTVEDRLRDHSETLDARLAAPLGALQQHAEISRRLADELAGGLGHKTDLANDKLDRLESGVAIRQDRLELLLARLVRAPPEVAAPPPGPNLAAIATTIGREIDRLDGYLLHHATMLREAAAGNAAILAAINGRLERLPVHLGPQLDAMIHTAGFDVVIPTHETALLAMVLQGAFERMESETRDVLHGIVRPGDVVVDAGANIGLHALPLAAWIGPEGRLLCFEPEPALAASLSRSMRANAFSGRTTVHCAALADTTGETTFHRAEHGPMSSLFPLPAQEHARAITVRLTTLDAAIPPGGRVDVVKVDVEGAEPRVWRGMQRVLRDNPRIAIVLEWSGSHFRRAGEDPATFMAEIRSAGFAVRKIGGDETIPADTGTLEGANLLLTRGLDAFAQ